MQEMSKDNRKRVEDGIIRNLLDFLRDTTPEPDRSISKILIDFSTIGRNMCIYGVWNEFQHFWFDALMRGIRIASGERRTKQ